MEQNASCLPKAQWLSRSIHYCIHFHFMLQQPLCLTSSSCVPAPSLVSCTDQKQKRADNPENTAQATTDISASLQYVTGPDYELLTSPASIFINSHCNQTFIARMMQTSVLLPKLPQAWHSLHMNLQWLMHIH